MGGEVYKAGSTHTQLFYEMIEGLGWTKVIEQDMNVPCSKCTVQKTTGKPKTHGVDLLLVQKCPYTGIHRGIVVDGKRYSESSLKVTGAKGLRKMLEDLKNRIECLDVSLSELQIQYDIPNDTRIDTGILAIDCHDADSSVGNIADMIKKTKYFPRYCNKAISLFILDNKYLNRLASIHNFAKSNDIEFFYNPEFSLKAVPVISPELLVSDIIPMRYREKTQSNYRTGIFYFDESPDKFIRFLISVLAYFQLQSQDEIDVFVPKQKVTLDGLQTAIDQHRKELMCKILVKQLSKVEYES